MSHARQQIREAIAGQLDSLTTTGDNVFTSRIRPLAESALPALSIYTQMEQVVETEGVLNSFKQTRELTVIIRATARATASVDDDLDEICSEVEAAIYDDPTLGSSGVEEVEYMGVEIGLAASNTEVGEAHMTWRIIYRVDASSPETLID